MTPLLAGCGGGGGDEGYVAVGAAEPSAPGSSAERVPPEGGVELVPLDEGGEAAGEGSSWSPSLEDTPSGAGTAPSDAGGEADDAGGGSQSPGPEPGGSADPDPDPSPDPSPSGDDAGAGDGGSDSGTARPGGPAALKVGEPERKKTDDRWCEKVTVAFRNTGGEPVRTGTVTFGTHIIGGLGVDWATIESERKLPVPIGAGEKKEKTWTVCVDQWRVPLGMHIETQDVKVTGWKR
ncbi:hypothetical protein ACWGJ2_14960 [Streptomyces sp. NPDC054796]